MYKPVNASAIASFVFSLCLIVFAADSVRAVSQIDIAGPVGSGQFGADFRLLPNGNIVVIDAFYDLPEPIADVGAVYLYDGVTGALISQVTGSTANDRVGNGGIIITPNGDFIFRSSLWSNGANTGAGAVTWCSGMNGCAGTVSAANSFVGSSVDDNIGNTGISFLANGDYIFGSPAWNNGGTANVGAVTIGNGTTGSGGIISSANSIIGSTAEDQISGGSIHLLNTGNVVVRSPNWDNGGIINAGAATFINSAVGTSGVVSPANSLVGFAANDQVGFSVVLPNGNYIVLSSSWDNGAIVNAGAATWCSGASGCAGTVSAANSLVGSTANDNVGATITLLSSGNYVIGSFLWDNGAIVNAGAATWCSSVSGTIGAVSAANSLVGSTLEDRVGSIGINALANGNYVVRSPIWNNGAVADVGAVTFGNGATGISGAVSAANSLVGSTAGDSIGSSVTVLTNNNYVVNSSGWDNGAVVGAGMARWCSGITASCVGTISAANALVGTKTNDNVGLSVIALTNGNYVVRNSNWSSTTASSVGAVTWCNGASGTIGAVSAANSLVGSTGSDAVGSFVSPLPNGNYFVSSTGWDNGAATNAGAATFGNGAGGTIGAVSAANSLVGSNVNDGVGGNITNLSNGNYIVRNTSWNGSRGAITWSSGMTATVGIVSAANSVVGSTANDQVGSQGIAALTNGNYVISSPRWDNGAAVDAGAFTWGNGAIGTNGAVSSANSVVGLTTNDLVGGNGAFVLNNGNYVVFTTNWDNGALTNVGAVTWGNGLGGTNGIISSANSLVGSTGGDQIGNVTGTVSGNYVIYGGNWDNGAIVNAGAVSFGAGNGGTVGTITADNSVRSFAANGLSTFPIYNPVHENYVQQRAVENIVSIFNPTYAAVADGNWTSGETWNFGAFTKDHDVYVPNGRTVNLDIIDVVSSLRIDCTGVINGVGASAYIIGGIRKDFCATGAFTYPTGTANGFSPVNSNITALAVNPSSLTVRAVQNIHPTLNVANSLRRFWTLTESGDLTTNLTFNYLDPTDITTAESSYKLYRVIGGVPTPVTPFTLDTGGNTISTNNVSSFSDWAVGNPVATAANVSVSGIVTDAKGNGIARVVVFLTDNNGNLHRAMTNSFGRYNFTAIPAGATYTATAAAKKYRFDAQVITLNESVSDVNFIAQE